jgi:hypothetical protein
MAINPPLVGEIITIGRSQKQLLVVYSQKVTNHDHIRGEAYHVHQLQCIEIASDQWGRPRQLMSYPSPKLIELYLEGGSMRGRGRQIKLDTITVVGLTKLSTTVTTTYHMDQPVYIASR